MVRVAGAIFVAALALRLILLFGFSRYDSVEPREMERVARSYALTGELANPYATATGPTAHVLPLYPVLLGTIYRIWGTERAGRLAQGIWSCTLCALRCALLFPLVLYIGLDRRTALLSAILSTVYIPAFGTELLGGWEAPLAALFLMGLVVFAVRHIRSRPLRFLEAAAFGLYIGVSTLLSATLLFAALGLTAGGTWVYRRQLGRYLLWSGIALLMVLVCLAPWALRNQRRLGHVVWLRSNLGFELWQAYRVGAGVGALDTDVRVGPTLDPKSSEEVRALGEVRYHELLKEEAIAQIRSHPGTALRLFWGHVVAFWFPPGQFFLLRLQRIALTLTAACGMFLLLKRRIPGGYVMALVWVFFPLVYYVVYWSSRYRYPMEWTLVVAASAALTAGWSLLPQRNGRIHA